MWQSILVGILVAAMAVYVARHFVRVLGGRKSHCGCCSECQGLKPRGGFAERTPGCADWAGGQHDGAGSGDAGKGTA